MKIQLTSLLATTLLLVSCDADIHVPPAGGGDKTTIVNPPAENKTTIVTPAAEKKVENNTTIVNPAPEVEKKVETNTTIVNPPAEKKD